MSDNKTRIEKPHTKSVDDVLQALESSPEGLSASEAGERLHSIGPNRLPDAEKEGPIKRFFKQFHDLLIYILIVAGLITAALGHWIDTGVIFGVVLINAAIGFIQEGKAEKALEGIRKMLSLHAHARRDGEWKEISAEELVPGDVVRLRSGDRVPADLRLIKSTNLRIEESALTGESVPAEKNTEAVGEDAGVGDRTGMAFSGTLVTGGSGTGVVTATGSQTEIGRINVMISDVQTIETPLTRQMKQFGKILSVVIVGLAAAMFAIGHFLHGTSADDLFLAAIGFAVAAIPEGLPAILTITLALGVQVMARRNAITRRLKAVETLGSVTVICSDKTGTLTKNEMTVQQVVTPAEQYKISGTGYAPEGEISLDDRAVTTGEQADLHALVEAMAVCNDAEIAKEEGQWKLTGGPTEGALRTLALKAGFDDDPYERIAVVPFESENKLMATLNRTPDGERRIFVTGAPDRLLARCNAQHAADGEPADLDTTFWEKQIDELGTQGLRVLAAASRPAEDGRDELTIDDLESDLVFLGIAGLLDPPRPEAIEAIRICAEAGIRVKMITGDHAGTAKAIGKEMGIGDGDHAVTGAEIESASDEQLRELARENDVFARTSPEHKLRLVQALQANGEVVAMTGDGVNDAPALKRADVGVAMGIKGTEATKEAADIVLADDNFQSIEQAVEKGRAIYDNLRKAILFILPTNGAQGLVVLAAVISGTVLPLTPVQILWVNMVVAVTLALALAFEPPEPSVMKRPPRDPGAAILDALFVWRIAFVSTLIAGAAIAIFHLEQQQGRSLDVSRTMAVHTLVFAQMCYLFNSRFLTESSLRKARWFTNPAAWTAAGILLLLQAGFIYLPFMNHWFSTAPLDALDWLIPAGIGAALFLLVEAEKTVCRAIQSRATR